ncbi:MAG: DoxX family protein [Terracidiphilus sp.]|jgi:uncharacterized membrane protein
MNRLDLFALYLLAGIFFFAGISKFIVLEWFKGSQRSGLSQKSVELTRRTAFAVAVLEIAGALALVVPVHLWTPGMLPRVAAGGLALLALAISIYRYRRQQFAEPVIALFLLALFVVIGLS